MKSVGVVIVCRYNSTRLPGKILKKIEGKSILNRIYYRINQVISQNHIIVATSIEESDDRIQEFCDKNNIQCYRGSLKNTALRFLEAGDQLGTDYIIRINGDNLFIDLDTFSKVIDISKQGNYNFISNVKDRTFPYGMSIESVNRDRFREVFHKNIKSSSHKEHITLVLYEFPKLLNSFFIYNTKVPRAKGINLAIDTPSDFEKAKLLVKKIEHSKKDYSLSNLIDLYFNISDE